MCRTSAPPRRDLFQIEQTLSVDTQKSTTTEPDPKGSFLLPRLPVRGWTTKRVAIYNANYAVNGDLFLDLARPWTVLTPCDFRAFDTYAEAATYAFKGMTK